jgi:hypothetical protein
MPGRSLYQLRPLGSLGAPTGRAIARPSAASAPSRFNVFALLPAVCCCCVCLVQYRSISALLVILLHYPSISVHNSYKHRLTPD